MRHTSARGNQVNRLAATLGAVLIVTVLGGAGLAAASASTASMATSGTEHFYLMTTQPSAARYAVIASGVFTSGGVDISGNTADLVKVKGGSFKIHHGGSIHIVKQVIDKKTCLAEFKATADFTISGGTGAYKKLSGSGNGLLVDHRVGVRVARALLRADKMARSLITALPEPLSFLYALRCHRRS
jgi:hypothetical protein